jgi:hypothetical protein
MRRRGEELGKRPPWDLAYVLILQVVKVAYFHTDLYVFVLKVVMGLDGWEVRIS